MTVDVLLAAYNGENYIRAQLDSLICQTYKDIRILVSDDCSTDSTAHIINEYAEKYDNIHYFKTEKNLGYAGNFGSLLRRVEAPFYMLCDQDDVWEPGKIGLSMDYLLKNDADLVYTDLAVVDGGLNTIHPSMIDFSKTRVYQNKFTDYRLVYLRNYVTGCTVLAKSKFIEKILPVPEEFPMVHDWWIVLMTGQTGKICFLDTVTVKYRQHGDNQIGVYQRPDQSFDEYRDYYTGLRVSQFKIYVKNEARFESEELRTLNRKAVLYFEKIRNKRLCNFRNYGIFFGVYKYEIPGRKLKRFMLLNFPVFGRFLFRLGRRK